MKIALIAPSYLPSRRANTFQVMKMSQAFVELGHKLYVIVPRLRHLETGKALPSLRELTHYYGLQAAMLETVGSQSKGISIEWLETSEHLRRYDFSWKAVQRALKWGADIIYTRVPQAAALSSMIGIPTIIEMHDLPQGRISPGLLKAFLRGRGARRLIVITHALAQDLATLVKLPLPTENAHSFTLVAPDAVDLDRYIDLPSPIEARQKLRQNAVQVDRLASLPERFTVGYTGHMYPGRGAEMILEMADRLPEMNFLLVGGEAHDLQHLSQIIETLELKNVTLVGFVANSDLPLYQAACEVLLMPYQNKVQASSGGDIARYLSPMKLFEYLACGRVIVSSNLPVLCEILNAKNAILLAPDDLPGWVNTLRDLHNAPERRERYAQQASQDARRFTWQARAALILAGLPENGASL